MKRTLRILVLTFLAALVLTVSALADSGPKPLLTVRVKNAPEELYYLDVLAEGEYEGHTYGGGESEYSGIDWNYTPEEAAALDGELLEALRSAVPEGWHACTAEGTGGAPMWGDLEGEDSLSGVRLHTFGYAGLPDTYRILLVTKSGGTYLSPLCTRTALQSSATVDWEAKSVEVPPAWVGYALQFLCTFLPTLVIEGVVLVLFGFARSRRNRIVFLLVNLVTQGALAAFFSTTAVQSGVGWWYFFLFVPAEIVIALAEGGLYARLLTGSRRRAFAYGITANLCSALLGLVTVVPLWQWIVSIS